LITAVDTSVLLDVFGADAEFGPRSAETLRKCLTTGSVIACDVVWAETAASFAIPTDAEAALASLRVDFSPTFAQASLTASQSWRAYRQAGGQHDRVIADFLIASHAQASADQLLTRDRGFYRKYFQDLKILDPTAS
jgi:predicted nucleic acid-binding protein